MVHTASPSVSFPVDDVQPAPDRLSVEAAPAALAPLAGTAVEVDPSVPSLVGGITYHPLIATVHLAFSQHRPLVLSPDMLWITILQGLAHRIAIEPERFRGAVGVAEGRTTLTVTAGGDPRARRAPWREIAMAFGRQMDAHAPALGTLGSVRFGTTGPDEAMVTRIALMDAFQHYFDYEVHCVCGIPTVTLEGTPDDWRALRAAVEHLRPFDLGWWIERLTRWLDELVRAASGSPDRRLWQDIYKLKKVYGGSVANGWLLEFIPFVRAAASQLPVIQNPVFDGHGISSRALPTGLSSASIQLTGECEPRVVDMVGGVIGATQDPVTGALRPRIGWALRAPSRMRVLLAKIAERQPGTPPRAAGELQQLMEQRLEGRFPAELAEFYAAMDGATVGSCRILPLAELAPAWQRARTPSISLALERFRAARRGEKPPDPSVSSGWWAFGRLADGSTLLVNPVVAVFGGGFPIAHCPAGARPEDSEMPVVARSFRELVEDLLAAGDRYLLADGPAKRVGHVPPHSSSHAMPQIEYDR